MERSCPLLSEKIVISVKEYIRLLEPKIALGFKFFHAKPSMIDNVTDIEMSDTNENHSDSGTDEEFGFDMPNSNEEDDVSINELGNQEELSTPLGHHSDMPAEVLPIENVYSSQSFVL
jgi:hypothetical protein